ncbi:MAG: threonine--tRNA ligase [Candidatus Nealsonbacteria bacterium]|nr:threonine--tRNA ligase [Candidatus Nealsonbacteria bacterium]
MSDETEKRDHRKIGEELDLFSFHDVAPSTPFWHPKGVIIIQELKNYIRNLQKERGYLEIITPILVKKKLYETSGHWEHYKENIFSLDVDKETFALKPMNCPGAVLVYSSKIRSYKDLPLRFSEFGNLHRRERTGVVSGLFRVYGFTQDDAHIFCEPNQIAEEIEGTLNLIIEIHKRFQLKTFFALATKPDKAMGDPMLWEKAEDALRIVLQKNKLKHEVHEKDGAFYGPKIDVDVEDSLGRKWTVATVQLDFQMPERFDIFYIGQNSDKQRPVMIHRSSIGSFERFMGILIEHYAGAFPFWLAPVQARVIPVSDKHLEYAEKIKKELSEFRVELDSENETLGKKIRNGEMQKIPYLIIIGDREIASNQISIRERGKGDLGGMELSEFLKKVKMQ